MKEQNLQQTGSKRLTNDNFIRQRCQLGDDLPSWLSFYQNPSTRSHTANGGPNLRRTPQFISRTVGQIGTVSLARVQNVVTLLAQTGQHVLNGFNGTTCQRKIVSHLVDISTHTTKVHLHINHNNARVGWSQVSILEYVFGLAEIEMMREMDASVRLKFQRRIHTGR